MTEVCHPEKRVIKQYFAKILQNRFLNSFFFLYFFLKLAPKEIEGRVSHYRWFGFFVFFTSKFSFSLYIFATKY